MEENGIDGIYQSAYRAHHSAETALVRIHNDIAHSIDNRQSVLLVLLDLSCGLRHHRPYNTAATVFWVRVIWGRPRLADILLV